MKTLITVLIITLVAVVSYPTVSKSYNDALEFKSALREEAKQACNNDRDLKWVKLAGSLEIFKCN